MFVTVDILGYKNKNGDREVIVYIATFSWAGVLIPMSDRWLPKRIVFGNLEDVVRRGRGGRAKE